MAMTSGSGVVIQPAHTSAGTLALTMGTFVTRLLGQLNGQTDLPPEPPQVKNDANNKKRRVASSVVENLFRTLRHDEK